MSLAAPVCHLYYLYELVGESYIDGIIDGEAVDAMKAGRNHRGPFELQVLSKELYKYPSLREGKEMMKRLPDEACHLDKQVHARLEVSTIELE